MPAYLADGNRRSRRFPSHDFRQHAMLGSGQDISMRIIFAPAEITLIFRFRFSMPLCWLAMGDFGEPIHSAQPLALAASRLLSAFATGLAHFSDNTPDGPASRAHAPAGLEYAATAFISDGLYFSPPRRDNAAGDLDEHF